MFDVTKIQNGLTGLVALRQPTQTAYDRLLPAQYLSTSGLFLDDVEHFRFEYWVDSQNDATISDSDLQTTWSNLEASTIANVMARVFNRPTYIDRNLIYSNPFDRNELVTLSTNPAMFYGYEIKVSDKKNVAFMISNVRIEASTTVAGSVLTINLFHSSQALPIKTKSVTLTNNGTLQIERLDWYIDMSDNYYKGQFYIGYDSPAFEFKPFQRNFERADIQNNIAELEIRRCENLGAFSNLENVDYTDTHNGLNFDITVYNDYTDLILQNKFIFARAIQLQWASSILSSIISSSRSNRNERIAKEMISLILLTLEGQSGFGLQRVKGLKEQIAGELTRLQTEIDQIINGYFTSEIVMTTTC